MSLRDRILSANDIATRIFHVSEWGVDLEIRTLSTLDRTRMIKACSDSEGNVDLEKMYPLLIIASAYDPETGEKVFEQSDMDAISDKSASAVERVAKVAMEMSGMNPNAIDAEGKDS